MRKKLYFTDKRNTFIEDSSLYIICVCLRQGLKNCGKPFLAPLFFQCNLRNYGDINHSHCIQHMMLNINIRFRMHLNSYVYSKGTMVPTQH